MAKYRTYKNGITGHRYKGYYIIKGETKGKFAIWNEDKTVFKDNIYDYEDCEWIIDKETVDHSDMVMIKMLYEKEIHELSALKSQNLYNWVEKVRKRKAEDREF